MVKRGPTNPLTLSLIAKLRATKAPVWRRAAELLQKLTRDKVEVNLTEISRFAAEGETIVVPGKVLGTGSLSAGKLSVASHGISLAAAEKVKRSGGKVYTLEELAKQNPEGKNLRLFS